MLQVRVRGVTGALVTGAIICDLVPPHSTEQWFVAVYRVKNTAIRHSWCCHVQ